MTKLCPRGKAAAKRKFAVYPSAYANAYASKVCAGKIKDDRGTKRKDFRGPKPKKAGGGKIKLAGGGKTARAYRTTTRPKMSTKPKPTVKEDTTFIDYKKIAGMNDSKKTKARPARSPLRRKMKMKKGGIARGCGVVKRKKVTKYY